MRRISQLLAPLAVVLALAGCGSPSHHASVVSSTTTSTTSTVPAPAPATSCSDGDQTMNCVLNQYGPPPVAGLHPSATASTEGVDFAFGGLPVSEVKANGWKFGASYLSLDPSKNSTRSLVNAYHAAGIATVFVWETSANRAQGTRAEGVSDALTARAQAAALGNTNRPIDFAIDCDCAGPTLVPYFQGVHSVLGNRADAYGGHDQVLFLFDKHLVGHQNWQTYAWSGVNGVTQWLPSSIAPLEQYLNGASFDHDRAIAADYGQTPYTPAPVNIGGAQHYQNYPNDAPAKPRRERQTVMGWDTGNGSGRRCTLPVRRASCRVTRAHLIYDLQRDQAIYQRASKKQRLALHLPGRIQGLSHRINNRHGVVNRWL